MILRTSLGPLYYEEYGQGPPVVFISGWAMSSECWKACIPFLHHYRCIIFDARGIGRSQPVSANAGFELEDHAEDLHFLLESLHLFDAALVGHESGGLVAAISARRHPQYARSLSLVRLRRVALEKEIRRLAAFTPAAIALRELAAFPLIRNLVASRFRRAPQPYRDRLFDDFASLNPRAAYQTAISAAAPEPALLLEQLIVEGRPPSLFISGEKDKKSTEYSRKLFSSAPGGKLATMSDCGFLPMLEYPRQFARLLDKFISGTLPRQDRALRRR